MALSFIHYDYDTIARAFIYGIARVHLQEIENLANSIADFLKKRLSLIFRKCLYRLEFILLLLEG